MARRSRRVEGGQVLVLFALCGVVLAAFASFAIDTGQSMDDRRQLQAVADSAALAGAQSYTTVSKANYVAFQYVAAARSLTIPAACTVASCPDGSYSPPGYVVTFVNAASPVSVQVTISHTRPTLFGAFVGFSSLVTATGARAGAGYAPCGVCALSKTASPGIGASGKSTLNVTGAPIAVNSTAATAFSGGTQAVISAPSIQVAGGSSCTTCTPTPTTVSSPALDMFSSVPVPSFAGLTAQSAAYSCSVTCTVQPGIYGTMTIAPASGYTVTFAPGVYIVLGELSVSNVGSVVGSGVTFYFTCATYPTPVACLSTGQAGGYYFQNGAPVVTLAAPTGGSLAGMLFYSDRNNTATDTLTGGGGSTFTGDIYAKSANVTVTGTSSALAANSTIAANTVTVTGTGTINLNSSNYVGGAPRSVGLRR
ncbi:MAG: pilus assembly protein TadG-related protein [Candidatus Dormibacteria bacterium]